MAKRAWLQIAGLVVGAALIAACGSSSPTTGATSTRGGSVGAGAGGSGGAATSRAAVELATCNSTAARSRLSTSGKAKYLTLCKQAVTGQGAKVKQDAARQCQQIIKQTVPTAAQATLIAGCPRA
jgi:hypothetical protein